MKYIIELREEANMVQAINVTQNGTVYIDAKYVTELKELNSDYINEHYRELQDTAYKRGLHEGNDIGYKDGVNDGRNEAWEAAKKIVEMTDPPYWKVFSEYKDDLFGKITASEAIEKLKAYEEKKENEEIKVGDIIANNTESKLKVWVTCFDEIGFCGIAITDFGTVDEGNLYVSCSPKGWHKIGHFDIPKILEEMKK